MKFTYPSGSRPLKGYTIKRGIGIGGFGEVYFALSDAGKEVALKKIQRNLDVELRGVKQCLNIRHVNLISLWDIRTSARNESWVVMEYVPGPSLRDILYDYPDGLPEEDIKLWMTSTASGVAHLHQRGIVHRDLKPGNIFRDDDAQVIKIGDYGLSKFISSRRSGHTETVGTVHYMAPEIGKGDYGKEIDVYALGIIFYELLLGDVPFDGESSQEIIVKHLTEMPKIDLLPSKFRDVIAKALSKVPGQRYRNVSSMVSEMPWPDVAAKSSQIAAFHAVGVFPSDASGGANGRASQHANPDVPPAGGNQVDRTGALIKPILIADNQVEVVRPDIVFGPLSDHSKAGNRNRAIRKTTPPRREQDLSGNVNGLASGKVGEQKDVPSGEVQPRPRKLAKRTTVIGADELAPQDPSDPIQVLRTSEPAPIGPSNVLMSSVGRSAIVSGLFLGLANQIGPKYDAVSQWWSNSGLASLVKLVLLLIAGSLIIAFPDWILPCALCLGMVFIAHFLVRTWLADFRPSRNGKSKDPEIQERRYRTELHKRQCDSVREWIEVRPVADRLTELIGSFFIGGLTCVVLSLLGMAMHDSIFSMVVANWAYYTWVTITSVVACWTILSFGKLWEVRKGEAWFRQLTMGLAGIAVWVAAMFFANIFSVDLSRVAQADFARKIISTGAPLISLPPLFGHLIFFVGLFAAIRWWTKADPVRRTRLSIWNVALSLVWAAAISQVFGLPMIGNCVLAVAVSISVQVASPWLCTNRRELIQATLKSPAGTS